MSDNAEWIMTDINEKKLPDPPPVCNSKLRIKPSHVKHPSRKEKYNMLNEKKMNEIVENTIILAPDWFCRKRKKKY